MAVVLALSCAVAWGVSDFLGGLWSRRHGPWVTALVVQVGALIAMTSAWLLHPHPLTTAQTLWALLTGIGVGAGTGLLYRGLSRGSMGIVAPLSAVTAALVPVTVGLATGERPTVWATVGISAALPAIWLISADLHDGGRGGELDGLLSGLGFGLAFVGLAQAGPQAGFARLAIIQLGSIVPILVLARVVGEKAIPRSRAAWAAAWIGPIGATANIAFVWAVQHGQLTVTSVLASLYPAVTVVLAALVLRESIRRTQATGLALATLAVVLISLG